MSISKNRFQKLAGILTEEQADMKTESTYHFVGADKINKVVKQHLIQMVHDLDDVLNIYDEDKEEVVADLENMILNYFRQISR